MRKVFYVVGFLCMISFISCTKEEIKAPEISIEGLLTNKNWKIEEITFLQNNILYYYKRGGTSNSFNFSNDAIVFKNDGTGTYTAQSNVVFNINWQFVDTEKNKIRFTIYNYDKGVFKNGVNLIVTWENVQVTSTSFRYAEIYTNSDGTATISSGKRIPL